MLHARQTRKWIWHKKCLEELHKLRPPECFDVADDCVVRWCHGEDGPWVKHLGGGILEFKRNVPGSAQLRVYFVMRNGVGIGLLAHLKKGRVNQQRYLEKARRRADQLPDGL